jgi:hypothetical protein
MSLPSLAGLAQLRHDVVLVEKLRFPRTHIGESLPSSVIPLFRLG